MDFTANLLDRAGGNRRDEGPIFIVGLPRSGTSLVEQILASDPEVHGAGELESLRQIFAMIPELSDGQGAVRGINSQTPLDFHRG